MWKNRFLGLSLLFLLSPLYAAAPRGCAAGMSLGSFSLEVALSGTEKGRPLQQVNMIRAGDKIRYRPVEPLKSLKKGARVSLVQLPHDKQGKLSVSEPKPAARPAEWTAPFRVTVVCVVFGPQGLDRKKINSLVNKDQELVNQLADYADQTEKVESLIGALSTAEQSLSPSNDLNAALAGFATQYGTMVPKLDRTAPTDQQAAMLLKTLNPALSSYDPLASDPSRRMQQSAGLAASVAALFFGPNVGLASGGAAMVQNLRTMLFPETDFRSALAQPVDSNTLLCAKRESAKSHTRMAYLWAHRLPDSDAPVIKLPENVHLPLGAKSKVAVSIENGTDWKLVGRAHDWILISEDKHSFPVPVQVDTQAHILQLDLTNIGAAPGDYHLEAKWDWTSFEAVGVLHVHKLDDLKTVAIAPQSQELLIQGGGPVDVRLTGPDLEFIDKVLLDQKPLEFYVLGGRARGPQNTLDTIIDTRKLMVGPHELSLYQPDGSSCNLPLRLLPPNPKIENLPLHTNLGEAGQMLILRGTGLSRIEKVEAVGAQVELGPAADNMRRIVVYLDARAKPGDEIPLSLKVEGLNRELKIMGALQVVGPRPHIASVNLSLPDDLGVDLRPGELPAGSFVSFSMRVENVDARPALRIECVDPSLAAQNLTLRPGDKQSAVKLDMAGGNLLFLSFDPAVIGQPGCAIDTTIISEPVGPSDPEKLGRVIRLPRIESFALTNEKAGPSAYAGIITGHDLETIEKTGWASDAGLEIGDLPRPIAGQGQKQSLKIALPWPAPAPHTPLYIWLRGEAQGRATKATD